MRVAVGARARARGGAAAGGPRPAHLGRTAVQLALAQGDLTAGHPTQRLHCMKNHTTLRHMHICLVAGERSAAGGPRCTSGPAVGDSMRDGSSGGGDVTLLQCGAAVVPRGVIYAVWLCCMTTGWQGLTSWWQCQGEGDRPLLHAAFISTTTPIDDV